MMKDDPVISSIRKARHQISASVGHDPHRLAEYYKSRQERHRDRVVSRTATKSEDSPQKVAEDAAIYGVAEKVADAGRGLPKS